MSAIILTDSPRIAKLKAEYRKLDELHERMKFWPDDINRSTELENITTRKAEIAREILGL